MQVYKIDGQRYFEAREIVAHPLAEQLFPKTVIHHYRRLLEYRKIKPSKFRFVRNGSSGLVPIDDQENPAPRDRLMIRTSYVRKTYPGLFEKSTVREKLIDESPDSSGPSVFTASNTESERGDTPTRSEERSMIEEKIRLCDQKIELIQREKRLLEREFFNLRKAELESERR